jgi:hypothetical protein
MKTTNDSVVLFIYKTDSFTDPHKNALPASKFTEADFPRGASQIKKYFDHFWVSNKEETYPIYTTCKLGLNGDVGSFVTSMSQHARNFNGRFEKSALQYSDTVCAGYLPGTHRHMNVAQLQQIYTLQAKVLNSTRADAQNRLPEPPPFALQWKMIKDGISKPNRPPGYKSSWAIHVFCRKGQEKDVGRLIKTINKTHINKAGRVRQKIKYSPNLDPKILNVTELGLCAGFRAWHSEYIESIEHHYSVDIVNADVTVDKAPPIMSPDKGIMQTFSIRRWLLSRHPKGRPDVPLFLTVEIDEAHAGYNLTCSRKFTEEAKDIAMHLPVYIMKTYGEDPVTKETTPGGMAILKLFTAYGQNRYQTMEWDEKEQRVITFMEKEMKEDLKEMEEDSAPWIRDKPTVVETKSEEPTLRPLPRDCRASYDDQSCKTSGSAQTIKGFLERVDLNDVPDELVISIKAWIEHTEAEAAAKAAATVAAAVAALEGTTGGEVSNPSTEGVPAEEGHNNNNNNSTTNNDNGPNTHANDSKDYSHDSGSSLGSHEDGSSLGGNNEDDDEPPPPGARGNSIRNVWNSSLNVSMQTTNDEDMNDEDATSRFNNGTGDPFVGPGA